MEPTPAQDAAFRAIVKSGGIAAAAKAGHGDLSNLSRRYRELVEALGTELIYCDGRRFTLLRSGRRYYEFLEREAELRTEVIREIRAEEHPAEGLAGMHHIVELYAPLIFKKLKQRFPTLQCSSDSGTDEQIQQLIRRHDANIGIVPDHPGWKGFKRARLVDFDLALVYPASWGDLTAADLWGTGRVEHLLLYSSASETVLRHFFAGLKGLHVEWKRRQRLASADCAVRQALEGEGIALVLDVPSLVRRKGLKVIRLPKFEPVWLVAVWLGRRTPEHDSVIKAAIEIGREVKAGKWQ